MLEPEITKIESFTISNLSKKDIEVIKIGLDVSCDKSYAGRRDKLIIMFNKCL